MIKKILDKARGLQIKEKRRLGDEYCELIIYSKELDKWLNILTEFLGPPLKPAGQKPTLDNLVLTKDYGGIYENQILFRKDTAQNLTIVMLWPWQDSIHITLKITEVSKG